MDFPGGRSATPYSVDGGGRRAAVADEDLRRHLKSIASTAYAAKPSNSSVRLGDKIDASFILPPTPSWAPDLSWDLTPKSPVYRRPCWLDLRILRGGNIRREITSPRLFGRLFRATWWIAEA